LVTNPFFGSAGFGTKIMSTFLTKQTVHNPMEGSTNIPFGILYGSDDEEYVQTPLDFGIPPPQNFKPPKSHKSFPNSHSFRGFQQFQKGPYFIPSLIFAAEESETNEESPAISNTAAKMMVIQNTVLFVY
jgi:hypothetical protein